MSTEAMGVEQLVAARWRLDGFWVIERVPVRTPKGNWSDVDVLGWHAVNRTLRLGSCKAYGKSDVVETWPVPSGKVSQKAAARFLERQNESWRDMLRLFGDENYVQAGARDWLPPLKRVRSLELHFVGAIWIADSNGDGGARPDGNHEEARARLNDGLTRLAHARARKVDRLREELDRRLRVSGEASEYVSVLADCIRILGDRKGSGRRTGNPILDVLRELVRSTGGSARWAYAGPSATAAMRDSAVKTILGAVSPG